MATNKHATIRYHAIDKCLSNPGRRYSIDDIVEACNDAIYEYTGIYEGVKKRQVYNDIRFMESDQGWAIIIDKEKDGRRVYYKYADRNYSIKNQIINETEAIQLKEAISILNRFKGITHFEWMEDLLYKLETTFKIAPCHNKLVGFDQNPYLKGLDFFTTIFNAIYYKSVLKINYKSFKQSNSMVFNIHPYYLKEYNNRWFLFGYDSDTNKILNLALDRILEINKTNIKFIENKTIDFEEYFEDVVGVTVDENKEAVEVILQISNNLFPYIESKPIHGSQKIVDENENCVIIELTLQLNYEFISLIFSFGSDIVVLKPEALKTIIKDKAESVLKNYF